MSVLLCATGWDEAAWTEALMRADPALDLQTGPRPDRPDAVRYALTWKPPHDLWPRLPNLRGIVNLGAGVDALMETPDLPHIPIARCVDPDLSLRMAEYVTLHVLAHLRDLKRLEAAQADAAWAPRPDRAAHEVTVGLLGLGTLAATAAGPLRALGCELVGWSRTPKTIDGVTSFAGADALDAFLSETDILVALLPLTGETRGILNARTFAGLARRGGHAPSLINAGRGGLQVEADILAALDDGTLDCATLDVFETEPLASDHPFWSHPRVRVTPHVAAESAPEALAAYALRQIARMEAGEAPEHPVDRARGY